MQLGRISHLPDDQTEMKNLKSLYQFAVSVEA